MTALAVVPEFVWRRSARLTIRSFPIRPMAPSVNATTTTAAMIPAISSRFRGRG